MGLAPIAFFVYNRPLHTKKTIESLLRNNLADKSSLYIFSDAPKNGNVIKDVKEVRDYIKTISGFKNIEIIEREKNLGLADSIINGVTYVINKYWKVIVVEDDLIFLNSFLRFMNDALEFYADKKKVFSVTGYNYPEKLMKIPRNYNYDVYFCPRCSSWGWGTWIDRWDKADWEFKDTEIFLKDKKLQKAYSDSGEDKVDMVIAQIEGKIDSWATRWEYTHFKNNAYSVYPVKSLLNNIGFDGTGINSGYDKKYYYSNGLENSKYDIEFLDKIELDKNMMKEFSKIFKKDRLRNLKQIIKKVIFYDKWRKKR
ncbi:MAG: sugar transferase [Candidatus Humimicrobiaceae bacterium]